MKDLHIDAYQECYGSSPVPFCIVQVQLSASGMPEDYAFAYLNKPFADHLRAPVEHMQGRCFSEIFGRHPDEKYLRLCASCAIEKQSGCITEFWPETGDTVSMQYYPLHGLYIGCLLTDLSRAAELQKQNEHLLQNMPGAFALFTLTDHVAAAFQNDWIYRFCGYSPTEGALGNHKADVFSLVLREDVALLDQQFDRIRAGENSFSCNFRLQRKDGTHGYVNLMATEIERTPEKIVLQGIYTDVDQEMRLQQTLKAQADQLSLYHLTENAGIFRILLDQKLTLLYGNDRFYQIMEYSPEEFQALLDNSCLASVHADDRVVVLEQIAQARSSQNRFVKWMMRIRTGTGRVRYIQVTGAFQTAADGRLIMEGIQLDVTEQKETENALRLEQEKTAIALSSSSIIIWEYDILHHTTLQQPKGMNFFGVPQRMEHMPELAVEQGYVHPDSAQEYLNCYRLVEQGVPEAEATVRMQDHSGELHWVHMRLKTLYDDVGRPARAIGMSEDVTEQKLAQQQFEEELHYSQAAESEKLLVKVRCNLTRGLVESYVARDSVGISHDGMTYQAGVEALANTGYTEAEQELIRQHLEDTRVLREFEQGRHTYSLDYRRKTLDGRVIWVNTNVRTYRDMTTGDIKSFMYTTDIHQEKTNEEIIHTVAATEHEFMLLIDLSANSYFLYAGTTDGTPLPRQSGNDYVEMMQEVNRSAVVAEDQERAILDMMPDRMRSNLKDRRVFSAVYKAYDNNGNVLYKKIRYAWLHQSLNQIVMTRSDITDVMLEQQRQQELLRSALEQAEQASNAKTDFLSKMSHEIRTPMNAIIGMNALAAQSICDSEQVADCISKVGISARYLLSLINDILDMSRIESGKLNLHQEKFPFDDFLAGVNTICYEQAQEGGISYDSIVTSSVSDTYVGDAMKLQQILVNLLGNAIKFTPQGGKVQLIVSMERMEKDRAYMKFTVNDTGVGVSEEFQKVMFEPFEQEYGGVTTPYSGTGLGLAITKNLVGLMGGTITVNSIVGIGSEFNVILPLGLCEERQQKINAALHLEKMEALVVDDEILICEQTKKILNEMGMKAQWATSGQQAIEMVRNRWNAKKFFDIVLVDWKMPDMDGIETARQIRKIVGPDVTIIIITAYEWAEIEKEAKAAGVNLLVSKPLFRSSLLSTFERIYLEKAHKKAASRPTNYDFKGHRVLLVEDHLLNVEVAKRLLQSKGMEVEVAENGLVAIETFSAKPVGYFDAILMDIRMPVMDGITAARSIRQLKKKTARKIPIIAMSANAFDEDVEKSLAAGMNAHLSKPIEPQQLYDTLHHYLLEDWK